MNMILNQGVAKTAIEILTLISSSVLMVMSLLAEDIC